MAKMKYRIVLMAIIHRNNFKEILLGKRKREPEIDKWSLPGGIGALETEKDPFKAIVKEVYDDFLVNFDCKFYTKRFSEDPEPTVYLYFQGTLKEEPKLRSDSPTDKEIKWFSVDDILKMNIGFENVHKPVIQQFKKDFLK